MISSEKNITTNKSGKPGSIPAGNDDQRPFTKINFYMMGGCVALIIIGFLLMSGGGSSDPVAFNPEIFSTRRIVVGPALAFLGFLLMAFAIIYTPKEKKTGVEKTSGEE
ncbi:MAG: DUF3098 domain-containing protein [Muribaculaceae bacterium]|nr:DUF3098 domain-containing protein [Muribaculaceae bacterium]